MNRMIGYGFAFACWQRNSPEGAMPAGLLWDEKGQTLSGTPTLPGKYWVQIPPYTSPLRVEIAPRDFV